MKVVKKIAVLVSLSLSSISLGGPQNTEVSPPDQLSYGTLSEAGISCDALSPVEAEHFVFIGAREVVVMEVPASEIEVLDEGGADKDSCSQFHGQGEGDRREIITGLITSRKQLESRAPLDNCRDCLSIEVGEANKQDSRTVILSPTRAYTQTSFS